MGDYFSYTLILSCSYSLNNIIVQLLQRFRVPVLSAFLLRRLQFSTVSISQRHSFPTAGQTRKYYEPVQRSKHLEFFIFSQFNSSVSKYKYLNSNGSTTFPVCEIVKSNAPLFVLNFTSNLPPPLPLSS